jgi:transposase
MAKPPIAVRGIDLGKNSYSVARLDMNGAVVLRRRMTREMLVAFASKLPACIVAMEACGGAHFLGRTFAAQRHTVRLMSPEYVQPYVKSQKTDDRDAEAIAKARHDRRCALWRSRARHNSDLQVLHRARERLVTAQDLREEWESLDERIRAYDDEFAALTRENPQARQLATIPGIGVVNATALLAAVGDGSAFAKGRDLAAWLGLTPRQHSDRGQDQTLRDQQAGQQIPENPADSWCPGRLGALLPRHPRGSAHGYANC